MVRYFQILLLTGLFSLSSADEDFQPGGLIGVEFISGSSYFGNAAADLKNTDPRVDFNAFGGFQLLWRHFPGNWGIGVGTWYREFHGFFLRNLRDMEGAKMSYRGGLRAEVLRRFSLARFGFNSSFVQPSLSAIAERQWLSYRFHDLLKTYPARLDGYGGALRLELGHTVNRLVTICIGIETSFLDFREADKTELVFSSNISASYVYL